MTQDKAQAAGAVSIDSPEFHNMALEWAAAISKPSIERKWRGIVSHADAHAAQRFEAGKRDGLRLYGENLNRWANRAEAAEASLARLVEGVEGLPRFAEVANKHDSGYHVRSTVDGDYVKRVDLLALLPAKAEGLGRDNDVCHSPVCDERCRFPSCMGPAPAMGEELPPPDFDQVWAAFNDGLHKDARTAALHFWKAAQQYFEAGQTQFRAEVKRLTESCRRVQSEKQEAEEKIRACMALRQPGAVGDAYQRDHEKAVRAIEVAAEFTPALKECMPITPASAISHLAYLLANATPAAPVSQPAAQEVFGYVAYCTTENGTIYHTSRIMPNKRDADICAYQWEKDGCKTGVVELYTAPASLSAPAVKEADPRPLFDRKLADLQQHGYEVIGRILHKDGQYALFDSSCRWLDTPQYQRLMHEQDGSLFAVPAGLCRSDGRCQYAIDHGVEGMAACPAGKCVHPT